MLKAILSYSKKIPAEQEYSSQSFHLSLEQELPAALRQDEIRDQVHDTFNLVKRMVEDELKNGSSDGVKPNQAAKPGAEKSDDQASNAQIKYLTDLARDNNIGFEDLNKQVVEMYGVESVYRLKRRDCSRLINDMKRAKRRAA